MQRGVKSRIKIHDRLSQISVQFICIIMINYTIHWLPCNTLYNVQLFSLLITYVYTHALNYSDYFLPYQDNIENFYFIILFCNSKCIAICVSMLYENYLEKEVNNS